MIDGKRGAPPLPGFRGYFGFRVILRFRRFGREKKYRSLISYREICAHSLSLPEFHDSFLKRFDGRNQVVIRYGRRRPIVADMVRYFFSA